MYDKFIRVSEETLDRMKRIKGKGITYDRFINDLIDYKYLKKE